jgi:hypothetical protein
MKKNEKLNAYYHETFKKWLKGKCSPQSDSVSNSYEDETLKASYDAQRDLFLVGNKEYPRSQVAHIVDYEEEFNLLMIDMVQGHH